MMQRPSLIHISRFTQHGPMEHYYWFGLRSVPLVGNITFRRLVERFGSPQRVLEASADELAAKGVSPAVAGSISSYDYREAAERECLAVAASGARVVDCHSPDYPRLLRETADFPPYLYVKGALGGCDPAVAIVGSRRATPYGLQATSRLSAELVGHGVLVVSGMARGIDTAAHRGALQAGGNTVGVLGCGIDVIYPLENRRLFAEMAERGGLVSEFPMGTQPVAANFPRRNRIISGLSRGVLVVEAAEKSGSLITAQFALEQGREVFAIPGAITSGASRGTNRLIKQGAVLVETVNDILAELPPSGARDTEAPAAARSAHQQLEPGETAVCDLLAGGPLQIDEITARVVLTVQELSAMLLRLELRGIVMQLPGKIFALT